MDYLLGIHGRQKVSIYLESKNYAIIKFPGSSYWSGMYGTKYCPVHYVLIYKKDSEFWNGVHTYIHVGRIKKQEKNKFYDILDYCEIFGSANLKTFFGKG